MNQNLENTHNLSSRKRRIVAFIIDHYIFSFLITSITFLSLGSDFINETNFSNILSKMLPVMGIGLFLYFSKDAIKGISLGKWIMGIMVRDENNSSNVPSFGRLFIRNLYLIIWPVEFIVLATNQHKKRLGDKTAKAIVVKNPNKPAKLPRILALVIAGFTFFIVVFFFVGSVMKNSDAYKVAIIEIEKNEKIQSETGGIKDYGIMPTGSINMTNGNGEALLSIKVIGNDKDVNVDVYLIKEGNGEWELIELSKQ
ncbi:putative RDD family membrane protein YckC [Cellulophaga sp. RHA_52]|uniref:RDD family protein n=1 Tax=Cellulophaga sp. RHA_52 TaxID=1250036 RepID=UPI00119C4BCB|nr:RDD family protein [Cellulophaga sp. RHA_52]TVZ09802.1 putative RDD family membrane protein YckC [Cellulophaga sp. RHA_52]